MKRENKGKRKKSSVGKFYSTLGICVLVGIVIGVSGSILFEDFIDKYIFGDNFAFGIVRIYGILAIFIAFSLIHIIIHEAGHLIFGLLTGYTFVSFRVGSFTLIKEGGKIKRKKLSLPGTAGQCLLAPPPIVGGLFPFRLYNYGGVITNFITSAIAIGLIVLISSMPVLLAICLGCFAASGILLGATNGIPLKMGGIANDGFNVKSMKKDELARKSFHLQLDINAKQSMGMRMREMPEEWFMLPESADLTNVLVGYVKLLQYYRFVDLMDFTAAREVMEQFGAFLEELPAMYKNVIRAEKLFLELIGEKREAYIIENLTNEVKILLKKAKYEINIKRIAYTYQAKYLKDSVAAEKCYQEALKLAKVYPVRAEADTNMMLIEYVKNSA